jgi:glyoxylate carboligase
MVKYLSLSLFFFATLTLAVLPQPSSSESKQDVEFGLEKERQTTITFEVFDREFIFTNSAEDYHRSFQRLVANYRINISDEKLSEILLPLSSKDRTYLAETVLSLVLEANKFSVYKDNHFYNALTTTTSEITKLNIAAALEVALVDEYTKVAAVPSLYTLGQSADFRFLYLINHARYEILNALLHRSSER